jgi:hypothetical protein
MPTADIKMPADEDSDFGETDSRAQPSGVAFLSALFQSRVDRGWIGGGLRLRARVHAQQEMGSFFHCMRSPRSRLRHFCKQNGAPLKQSPNLNYRKATNENTHQYHHHGDLRRSHHGSRLSDHDQWADSLGHWL